MTHTYIHRFASGLVCNLTLNTDAEPHIRTDWSARSNRDVPPEYFAWRHTVLEDYARKTGLRIAVVDFLRIRCARCVGTPV